ncbi:MAG TPA: GDP-mannose 4,6-dehydratase [Anaerolineales bacterium]|nr:GDP-mannose 4,6-dehydratase [Anaerolineales bacterium]
MKALITGIAGFAGSHLAEYLLNQAGWEVYGCSLEADLPALLKGKVHGYQSLNLCDAQAVRDCIEQTQPDRIYHLAGQAFVPESWDKPWRTFELNVQTQLNIFQAVIGSGLQTRILLVSSLELYGNIPLAEMPVNEQSLPRPDTPYGVSKLAQDLLGAVFAHQYHLPIVAVRPLNHIGPRQDRRFVAPAFASQIARIEAGLQEPTLYVGDLSAKRDFTDVRDMVRAYHLLLEHGQSGESYNVGSGQVHTIQYLLDTLCSFSTTEITVQVDPARLRKSGKAPLTADTHKLQVATGWQPQIAFESTLLDLLNHERQAVQKL